MRLHDAIRSGDAIAVRRLIADGEMIDQIDKGHRPLTLAATIGHFEIVQELIVAGANPNATNAAGVAAIHVARDPATLVLLINAGADIDAPSETRGTTPLHAASASGIVAMVKVLLDRGADVNPVDANEETALMAAVKNRAVAIVRELIAAGADIERRNKYGSTALLLATQESSRSCLQIAETLIKAGANVNVVRRDGMTALRYACWKGDRSIVSMLICAGADVNYASEAGDTALTTLICEGPKDRHAMARLLLQAGADPEPRTSERHPDRACRGQNARGLAAAKRDKKMLALLDEFERK